MVDILLLQTKGLLYGMIVNAAYKQNQDSERSTRELGEKYEPPKPLNHQY